ncbi:hypothetical protein HXX76_010230 [Chlamydomonas incerta]|uniref:Uncharacterized protein n=1 Tax=Chlamydomonas incerta TaxID=51695 RepID=A0A835T220_CHLIN|nr:hypothetical protein HXX76_010230 [Chlamydomonas incerta]|eukprot:KAG2430131.1 hypothetical protein HXX76_010230 [Chlamydomonas incerta]
MSLDLYALLCDVENDVQSIPLQAAPPQKKKRVRRVDAELNVLQEQLQRKAEELQRAEAESLRLRQRLKLLETVLPVRENQIRLLQSEATQPVTGGGTVPPAARPRLAITELAPSDSDASSVDLGLSSGGGGGSSVTLNVPAGGRPLLEAGPSDSAGDITLLAPQPRSRESADAILQRFVAVWNRDVREAALLLAAHDARPQDPTPALKLTQLKDQNFPLLRAMWRDYPGLLIEVTRLNLDTGERADPPPDHWAAVVHGLRLTPEQRAACLGALDLYRERMGPALQERRSLAQQMSAALQQADGPCAAGAAAAGGPMQQLPGPAGWGAGGVGGGAPDGGGGKDVTLEFLSAAQSLQRNVAIEGTALGVIRDFLGAGVFNVVQMKRIAVLSHPFFPDCLSVLTALEELERRGGLAHKPAQA